MQITAQWQEVPPSTLKYTKLGRTLSSLGKFCEIVVLSIENMNLN
jgi:hypothetical protein